MVLPDVYMLKAIQLFGDKVLAHVAESTAPLPFARDRYAPPLATRDSRSTANSSTPVERKKPEDVLLGKADESNW